MMNAMPMMNMSSMMNAMPMMNQMMPMMNQMMPMMMPMMMCSTNCYMENGKMVCEMSPMGSMTKEMLTQCCDMMNRMMGMGMPMMMQCAGMMLCCSMPMEKAKTATRK